MLGITVSFLFKLVVVIPNFMSIKCIGGNLCSLASSYWFYVRLRVVDETRVLLHSQGSSAAEFWNLTNDGLYCHFGGHNKMTNNLNDEATSLITHDTCQQVCLVCSTY